MCVSVPAGPHGPRLMAPGTSRVRVRSCRSEVKASERASERSQSEGSQIPLWLAHRVGRRELDNSDRWFLGASPCATERSDYKKSGWNAGGRNNYNVLAPAVAARRSPLGAASRRPHQTLSEAAAAKFHKRQRAVHANSAPLGGRVNMY